MNFTSRILYIFFSSISCDSHTTGALIKPLERTLQMFHCTSMTTQVVDCGKKSGVHVCFIRLSEDHMWCVIRKMNCPHSVLLFDWWSTHVQLFLKEAVANSTWLQTTIEVCADVCVMDNIVYRGVSTTATRHGMR